MKRVILIRHATTDLAGKLCGRLDPPLNQTGILQSGELGSRFAREKIDRIYASNLRRAIQTAEAIANPLGLSVIEDKDLREISFGDWEGCRWADLQSLFPEQLRGWLDPSLDVSAPNGEGMQHFRSRVSKALTRIASEPSGDLTAVVTHLGVIRVALVTLARMDPESELLRGIKYCSAYEFVANGQTWTLSR